MASRNVIPNWLLNDREHARYLHWDVGDLEDSELQDELYALRPLLWGLPADSWLRERVAELEDELVRRRHPISETAYGYEPAPLPKPQPKPKLLARGIKI